MITRVELVAAWHLTRPGQWPILSGQLAVGMLLATGSREPRHWLPLFVAWLSWVVFLNGGTLAFNSAYDRDTGPVAYLANPPIPPQWLAPVAMGWMLVGVILGMIWVTPLFGLVLLGCAALSGLYSHPRFRWKSRPGWDLIINILGYGAATTAAGIISGTASLAPRPHPPANLGWIIAAFGLLFGSFYPLTQIYQSADDTDRGDRTLTTALGVPQVLFLALALGAAATIAMFLGLARIAHSRDILWVALPLAMWLSHLAWLLKRWKNRGRRAWEQAMYRGLALWALVDVGLVTTCLLLP